ncbi:hypothetical protein [Virgibacillus sp. CBA3643]|uniref:hypothetical protein n=1 Tax=Virgibacillus sp. CBA3643 TaxID=2942278 RepID=UPI0035A26494
MQKEDQIIGMLEKVMSKQDEHSQKLDEHTQILNEHSQKLDEHNQKLDEHSQKLDNHESTLQEHGQILTALRSGQEHLKAEVDGMKISNAKEFGELKDGWKNISTYLEVLRNDTFTNKLDIQKMKETMN